MYYRMSWKKQDLQSGKDFYFKIGLFDYDEVAELAIRIGDNVFHFREGDALTSIIPIEECIEIEKGIKESEEEYDIGDFIELEFLKLEPIELQKLGISVEPLKVLEENIDEHIGKSKDALQQFSFEEFISQTKDGFKRPRIVMEDGVSMSVQASAFHYCEPKRNGLESYESYEVSCPSEVIEELRDYVETPVESDEELLQSVFAFVPAELLSKIIMEHGGIDKDATLHPEKKLDGYKQEKDGMQRKNEKAQDLYDRIMAELGFELGDN